MLRIAGAHLQQETILSRDVMYLEHLWNRREPRRGLTFLVADHVRSNGDESQHPQVDDVRVDERHVTRDGAACFELANPLQNGRGREPDRFGDLGLRHPGVVLEKAEDPTVDLVDISLVTHNCRILF